MVSATAMHSIALFSYAFADSDAMAPSPGTKHYTCRELASLEVVPHPIKEFESVLSGPLRWRTSSERFGHQNGRELVTHWAEAGRMSFAIGTQIAPNSPVQYQPAASI